MRRSQRAPLPRAGQPTEAPIRTAGRFWLTAALKVGVHMLAYVDHVGQASLGARSSLFLCRVGTLERNEVGLAELVDVDNAVFGTQELFVVELPSWLKNVRPRCQFLRGAAVAFDGMDPDPLYQYPVVVRRVSVHARLEPAPCCFSSMPNGPFLWSPHKTENLTGEPGCISFHLRSAAGTVISCLPFATPTRPENQRVLARAKADGTAKLRPIMLW
jgi:hypothetical protein